MKKIFLTGATGAMGALMCKTLVKSGHKVVGTTRSLTGNRAEISKELQSLGINLVQMDVTNDESVNKAVGEAAKILDGIDVVVNNAGIGAIGIQEFFSVADMHKIFDVNVYGVQRVMRAAIPYLKKQKESTVIHISSGIGRLTFPFYSTYCASKYALEALAEGYRAELAGFGIETCIIEPGAMPTEFLDTMVKLQPRDESKVQSYGEMVSIPEMAMKGLKEALKGNPNQNPQTVANKLAELIDGPHGKKPFRTVVDFTFLKDPVDRYNELLHEITKNLYFANGMGDMLKLNKS